VSASTESLTCPQCEAALEAEARFCEECGAEITSPAASAAYAVPKAVCPQCGRQSAASSFCGECGARLEAVSIMPRLVEEPEAPPAHHDSITSASTPCSLHGTSISEVTRHSPSRKPRVALEVELNRSYRKDEASVLRCRATNLAGSELEVTLEVDIHFVDLRERDRCRTWKLGKGARQQVFTFNFLAPVAGDLNVDELKMTVRAAEDPEDVQVYRLPHDGLLLHVAGDEPAGDRAGVIINGNIIPQYAGDVKIQVDGASRARGDRDGEVVWEFIELLLDPEETRGAVYQASRQKDRSSAVLSPSIKEGLPRRKMACGKLTWETDGEERKSFLFATPKLAFGRSSGDRRKDVACDVILRRLPCRSEQADPENWRKNLAISSAHGLLMCTPDGEVCAQDLSGPRGAGLLLDGRRMTGDEWIELPEVCTLTVGQDLLCLRVRTFSAGTEHETLDLSPRAAAAGGDVRVGVENPGRVEAVRLRREDNCPEHEYLMLLRQAYLGSDEECTICVPAEGVEPVHARVVYYQGEFFLHTEVSRGVEVGGRSLRSNEWAPLAPGTRFRLGAVELTFDAVRPEDFKGL
jgi:hypothetical protein